MSISVLKSEITEKYSDKLPKDTQKQHPTENKKILNI